MVVNQYVDRIYKRKVSYFETCFTTAIGLTTSPIVMKINRFLHTIGNGFCLFLYVDKQRIQQKINYTKKLKTKEFSLYISQSRAILCVSSFSCFSIIGEVKILCFQLFFCDTHLYILRKNNKTI